jgi:hypothetical protein
MEGVKEISQEKIGNLLGDGETVGGEASQFILLRWKLWRPTSFILPPSTD